MIASDNQRIATAVKDRLLGLVPDASFNGILGKRVTRAAADILTGAAVPVLNVTGGRVYLTLLTAKVETVLAGGATNGRFQYNPTVGTTTDLCANVVITADEVGTLYGITGLKTDVMQETSSGAVRGLLSGGMILDTGAVEFITDADRTGEISILAFYIPLDDGATMEAA